MQKETSNTGKVFQFKAKEPGTGSKKRMNKLGKMPFYNGSNEELIKLLNNVLATELVCALRYKQHYFASKKAYAQSIYDEFKSHANEDFFHADMIAERIVQLGGDPDFGPSSLTRRSHIEYMPTTSLQDMIEENIVAKKIAIHSYLALIRYVGDSDLTTRSMLEKILVQEEKHAGDLKCWLTLSSISKALI